VADSDLAAGGKILLDAKGDILRAAQQSTGSKNKGDGRIRGLAVKRGLTPYQGDLKGDGTLMAGRELKFTAEGGINDCGTIGSCYAIVMTAANIVNQTGGVIQGALVG